VELPDAVIDVLTSLRNYLQDKCEPPVYVSDRRFMKAVNLLQVAAYADSRDQVGPCLLSNSLKCLPRTPTPLLP
jgi:MoxR-like ATPase